MCRGIPTPVARIAGDVAWVVEDGREHPVSLLGVEGVAVGDYVYHHAGLALSRLDPEDAELVLAALAELDALMAEPLGSDEP